jgi:hypothetical protein
MQFPYVVRQNLVIIDASDFRYANADHTIIDMTLTLADAAKGSVAVDFSAHSDDTEEHGRLLHAYGLARIPTVYALDPEKARHVIADSRYRAEVSGVVFGGMRIDTGRDSQGLITGATLASVLDPSYVCHWKTPEGFVELNAAMLAAVSQAVRGHVQACFDRERVLIEALDAGQFTDAMLEEGWPVYEQVPNNP